MAHLVIDLSRIGNGLGYLVAQAFLESRAQSVHGHLYSALGGGEAAGDLGVAHFASPAPEYDL